MKDDDSMKPAVKYDIDFVLNGERECFRELLESFDVSEGTTAFWLPGSDALPYYDLAFPLFVGRGYSREELSTLRRLYAVHSKRGHVLVPEDRLQDQRIAYGACFYLPTAPSDRKPERGASITLEQCFEPEVFYEIAGDAFGYDVRTRHFFAQHIHSSVRSGRCKMWTTRSEGAACACAAMFHTEKNGQYLFQCGVLPKSRGRGIMTSLLQHLLEEHDGPFIAVSEHPVICEKILPSLGFSNAGSVNVVPIEAIDQNE